MRNSKHTLNNNEVNTAYKGPTGNQFRFRLAPSFLAKAATKIPQACRIVDQSISSDIPRATVSRQSPLTSLTEERRVVIGRKASCSESDPNVGSDCLRGRLGTGGIMEDRRCSGELRCIHA